MAKVNVTRNCQVTLPREVRSKLKLRGGDVVEVLALDEQRAILTRIIPREMLEGAWDKEMSHAMAEARRL